MIEIVTKDNIKDINNKIIENIKNWFAYESGGSKDAVINISGGADSTYVAYILTQALGKEHVHGLLLPNGMQKDIEDSKEVVSNLKIDAKIINIENVFNDISGTIENLSACVNASDMKINLPPRIRMAYAYAFANAVNGRVIGTGNASERYIGYFTKFGDGACDYNPVSNILKTDLVELGLAFGIPERLIKKVPADGLSGKTDEEKIGFSYKVLDEYIKTGKCDDKSVKEKIDKMHKNSRHKFNAI